MNQKKIRIFITKTLYVKLYSILVQKNIRIPKTPISKCMFYDVLLYFKKDGRNYENRYFEAIFMENKLKGKINYSKIAKQYDCDPRTVNRYFNARNENPTVRKSRKIKKVTDGFIGAPLSGIPGYFDRVYRLNKSGLSLADSFRYAF